MLVIVGAVALAGALVWSVRRRYLVITVLGHSMMPTLRHGQKLVARRRRGNVPVQRAQIIVFVPPVPGEHCFHSDLAYRVKRIVAIAGDPAPPWLPRMAGDSTLLRVPPGMVAVLGDNPRSEDSRDYGCVPEASILALVRAPTGTSPGSPDLRPTARRASS